ncbi:MAG TPA: hypothetical protein VII06_18585 [Chloroflexota bacterium]|jgi:hypothetical protein
MSLDDLDQPHLLKRLGDLLGWNAPPPPGPWDAAIRLGCQALLQAPHELSAVQLEGLPVVDTIFGQRVLGLMDRAHSIAGEYGLRATVGYQRGRPQVTLARR